MLASGRAYVLTMCCIVTKSSDRAAAGIWKDSWGSERGSWSESACVFCEPDIPPTLLPPLPQHFCWEECVVRLLRWMAVPTFQTEQKMREGKEKSRPAPRRERLKMCYKGLLVIKRRRGWHYVGLSENVETVEKKSWPLFPKLPLRPHHKPTPIH